MRKLLSISFFFLLCSCGTISLEEDPIVKKHFSEYEITYLDSILTFFDNEVVKQTPSADFFSSYEELFLNIKESLDREYPSFPMDIDKQRLDNLFSTIPESFHEKLWYTKYSYNSETEDSTYFRGLISSGIYSSFLKSASEKNSFLNEYLSDLRDGASITPSMTAQMLLFPEKLNIKKERERLIYAIHFITLYRPSAH